MLDAHPATGRRIDGELCMEMRRLRLTIATHQAGVGFGQRAPVGIQRP
jgi:hypothetical protein